MPGLLRSRKPAEKQSSCRRVTCLLKGKNIRRERPASESGDGPLVRLDKIFHDEHVWEAVYKGAPVRRNRDMSRRPRCGETSAQLADLGRMPRAPMPADNGAASRELGVQRIRYRVDDDRSRHARTRGHALVSLLLTHGPVQKFSDASNNRIKRVLH